MSAELKLPGATDGYAIPGKSRGLLSIFGYRYLLALLVKKGITTRYHGSALGWGWSYVKPTVQFGIYYLVLGVFLNLNRGLPMFPVYLFSGIVVVNLFGEAFGNATKSIVGNKALVKKIYLPRELFPYSAVIVALVHFLPQLAVLVVVCLFFGWVPSLAAVGAILVAIAIVLISATGLGLLFGAINVSYRDSQNIVEMILMLVTWASPVLYSWTMVRDTLGPRAFAVYMWNPLTPAVELFHEAFWMPVISTVVERPPDLGFDALMAMIISVVFVVIGTFVFRRLEGNFAQDL